ncbi:MAG: YbjN domain-containing protein [Leptospiraceae bacterium]|nr:YbjN domain-containing protein [Leptospiraceae bacterium]
MPVIICAQPHHSGQAVSPADLTEAPTERQKAGDGQKNSANELNQGLTVDSEEQPTATRLLDRISQQQLLAVLRSQGYQIIKVDPGRPLVFRASGRIIWLYQYSDGDLQLLTVYKGMDTPLQRINTWNRKHRLGRAWIDSDSNPVYSADLLSDGGLTLQKVIIFINLFSRQSASFEAWLGQKESDK